MNPNISIRSSNLLLTFLLVFLSQYAMGQTFSKMEAVSSQGPYPQGRSNCLLQDQFGFIWVGSATGLYRYDGYDFVNYQFDPADSSSLPGDRITCMSETPSGDLLVGTSRGGLCRYLHLQDRFLRYDIPTGDSSQADQLSVLALLRDREGRIWVCARQGLWVGEGPEGKERFEQVWAYGKPFDKNPDAICQDSLGRIWVGMSAGGLAVISDPAQSLAFEGRQSPNRSLNHSGMMLIDPPITTASGHHIRYIPHSSLDTTGHDRFFYKLACTPNGEVWAGTNGGAYVFSEGFVRRYPLSEFRENHVRANVSSFHLDPQGHWWAVSITGFHRYEPISDQFQHFRLSEMGVREKGLNAYYDLLIDQQGGAWIAAQEGLFKSTGANRHFHTIEVVEGGRARTVTAALRDSHGQIWMGVENAGLALADSAGKLYGRYRRDPSDPHSLANDYVLKVFEDGKGQIWLGTYGGGLEEVLVERDGEGRVKDLKFRHWYGSKDLDRELNAIYIYDIEEDAKGRLWVGNFSGLSYRNPAKKRFHGWPVFVANDIAKGRDGSMWIASDAGLYYHSESEDSIFPYEIPPEAGFKIGYEVTLAVRQDKAGDIWVGCAKGVFRIGLGTGIYKWYREKEGLSGNIVKVLLPDGAGGLWMGTHKGLTHWDAASESFRNYHRSDGVLNNTFNGHAGFRASDGWLYMGGDNGLLYFHPDSLVEADFHPKLILTSLRIKGAPVEVGPSSSPEIPSLPAPMHTLRELELGPEHDAFSIGFAALDFKHPQQVRYQYRLLGFSEAWREAGATERQAHYTNLDPGEYRFQVRAANRDGILSPHTAELVITVHPPWWRTWWAFSLYFLLFAALAYAFITLRLRALRREMQTQARITQAREEERDLVRSNSSRDFHDEAGTKITRINLYLNLLQQQASDPATKTLMEKMEDNVQALAAGMRDFIWVLDPRHDSVSALLLRLKRFGDELFVPAEIEFQFENGVPEGAHFDADVQVKRHLLLIFKEAMHNAIRHAGCKRAWLRAGMEGKRLWIEFEDDGKGFEEEEMERVNGLVNMRNRAAEIKAVLEVDAEKGKGTRIRLQF